ncbi:unnamed protein product, partial [Rotaria sp. Silwood1]
EISVLLVNFVLFSFRH